MMGRYRSWRRDSGRPQTRGTVREVREFYPYRLDDARTLGDMVVTAWPDGGVRIEIATAQPHQVLEIARADRRPGRRSAAPGLGRCGCGAPG